MLMSRRYLEAGLDDAQRTFVGCIVRAVNSPVSVGFGLGVYSARW